MAKLYCCATRIGKLISKSGFFPCRCLLNCQMSARPLGLVLVLSHMFGYLEQKLLGRSRKSLVFLKSNFFGSEEFQVLAHVLQK
jgi:hypothetical protein